MIASRGKGEIAQRPHIVSHTVATLAAFSTLAIAGVLGWLVEDRTEVHRVTGYSASGETITMIMLGLQIYEVGLCIFTGRTKEYRKAFCGPGNIMVLHHVIVILLATLAIKYTYLHYYAAFFFGVPELSSVPLAFLDFFKGYPTVRSAFPMLNEISRSTFAAIFIPVRVFWFSAVSYQFWVDSLEFMATGPSSALMAVAVTFCVSNIIMLGLQYHWGSLIGKAILQKLRGSPEHKDA